MNRNHQELLKSWRGDKGAAEPLRPSDTFVVRPCSGFTLIELLVAVGIVAILATLSAPSFARLIQSNTRSSSVNTFLADLGYARSESIRRGGSVAMCRSDFPEAINPSCSVLTAHTGKGWASGWIVFHDLDNSGFKDASDPVLRAQAAIPAMDAILEGGSGAPAIFRFTDTGRLFDLSSATSLTFGGSSYDLNARRVLCIGFGGRARIAGDGSADCGTADL